MMHYIAPVLLIIALLQFTTPSGKAIWINPAEVVAVTHPNGECSEPSQSRVLTLSGTACLREPQEDVVKKLTK